MLEHARLLLLCLIYRVMKIKRMIISYITMNIIWQRVLIGMPLQIHNKLMLACEEADKETSDVPSGSKISNMKAYYNRLQSRMWYPL